MVWRSTRPAPIFVAEEMPVDPVTISTSGSSVTHYRGGMGRRGTSRDAPTSSVDPVQGSNTIFTSDTASVSAFTYTSTGALTLNNSQLATSSGLPPGGGNPRGVAIDPQAQNLYVAVDTDVGTWQFPVSGSTLSAATNHGDSDS